MVLKMCQGLSSSLSANISSTQKSNGTAPLLLDLYGPDAVGQRGLCPPLQILLEVKSSSFSRCQSRTESCKPMRAAWLETLFTGVYGLDASEAPRYSGCSFWRFLFCAHLNKLWRGRV